MEVRGLQKRQFCLSHMITHVSWVPLFLIAVFPIGCARNSLQSLEKAVVIPPPAPVEDVQVKFCTDTALPVNSRLKYLIIMDHSGSNQKNYLMNPDGSGAPLLNSQGLPTISDKYATDPTGFTRYGTSNTPGTLLNFLSSAPQNDPKNPLRWYSLIDFSDKARAFPADASFTSDASSFLNRVQQDAGAANGIPQDGGNTSYMSALTLAYTTIHNDVQKAKDCALLSPSSPSPGSWCPTPGKQFSSTYVVIFNSDGSPITSIRGIGIDASGNLVSTGPLQITKEPASQILGQVAAIIGLQANTAFVDSINLFTIYHYAAGNKDLSGEVLLQQMARSGNGVAYSALSNTIIDYTRFAPPGKLIKNTLSDILVTNSSVAWWKDGTLYLDSDMDGIPDDVEAVLGSDPLNPDSDGNGIGDFVEYQLNPGQPCKSKDSKGLCSSVGAIQYATTACSGITTRVVKLPPGARPLSGPAIQFAASDPNGLNNCEKKILNDAAGINNPDSNGDMIPDWLEFKNGLPFQVGSSPATMSRDLDDFNFYQKIKVSLPPNIPITQLPDPQMASYQLDQTSTSPLQDCYHLTVNNLPIMGSGNTVRVDVMMKSPILQNSLVYRVGKKALSGKSKRLNFNDWNDASEQQLGTWSSWP